MKEFFFFLRFLGVQREEGETGYNNGTNGQVVGNTKVVKFEHAKIPQYVCRVF